MLQKIIRVGNSAAVVLPQSIRRETGLAPGTQISIERKGKNVVISPSGQKIAKGVNAKFMKMVDEFISDHEDVLRELAKR